MQLPNLRDIFFFNYKRSHYLSGYNHKNSRKKISNLKVNITQTRESLDQAKIEKSEAIQLAVSTFITENEGLKKAITGLREKLEQAQIKIKDGNTAHAFKVFDLNLIRLRSTVASLRR